MPELPEVETVRQTLLRLVKDEIIEDVDCFVERIIKMDIQAFKKRLIGQRIHTIDRIGKHLMFMLDTDVLIIHLRMEGRFYLKDKADLINKHEHVVFHLSHGHILTYHDVRKFGTMHLVDKANYKHEYPINHVGLEPWDIDPRAFYETIKTRKLEIKTLLLDQHLISGLGNIYVDETLFLANIHPMRPGTSLSVFDVEKIISSARCVLHEAIKQGGTTIRTFEAMDGVHGRFQNILNVHTKKGQPCQVCGTTIIKMKVKGRGTYVCPTCQK